MHSPRQFRFNARNELDPTKEFYYYALCHVCKNASVNLRRCFQCKTLHYCGRDHQRQDWRAHRPLCTVMASTANNVQPPVDPTNLEFEAYKLELAAAWKFSLGRQLESFENHMWMFKKMCNVCYNHEVCKLCENCWSVAYCDEDHRQEDRENHDPFCASLRFCLVAHQQDARRDHVNVWAGVKFDFPREAMALPDTLEEWVNMIAVSNNIDLSNTPLEMAFGTDHFCYIAIILYALEMSRVARNAQRNQLVIHVMSTELNEAKYWRQVLHVLSHWIYNLRKINAYIVNTFVERREEIKYTLSECEQCKQKRFKGCVTFIDGYYTAHVDTIPHPDIILLFNTPLPEVGTEEWRHTVPKLAEMRRVPIVLTGNSNEYVESETIKFFSPQYRYYLRTTDNRYKSTRPRRNFSVGEPPIVYRHNSIAIVARK